MQKIVITGHRGYIGSRLLKRFPDAMTLDGDIMHAALPDADVIYHLAAYASVPESWNRPVDYMENLRTTVRLVHAYPNAKIIMASTCSIKDPSASPYGFSKWVAHEYLTRYHKNYVTTMFPNVFGDSPRSVVDIFRKREYLTINGDGSNVRDYVHVDDIVEALVKAKDWKTGEYELGSGKSVSTLQLAVASGKAYQFAPPVPEQKDGVIRNTTPDWSPTIDVLEYVKT